MTIDKQPSCADDSEPQLLPVDAAMARIANLVRPLATTETVSIADCLGRVLAQAVQSPIAVPSHTNSAMDGYAVRADDRDQAASTGLRVVGSAFAGRPWSGELQAGEAVRIFTGAVVPPGADTVIIQEHTELDVDTVRFASDFTPGQNIRHAGEDVAAGDRVFVGGEQMSPAHMCMLASLGINEVSVTRKPRVAFFSTGDELRAVSDPSSSPLNAGEVYDSNRYALLGALARMAVDTIDMGLVPDDPVAIRDTLERAGETADVVITSGGVSVGEADYVSKTLHDIGNVAFWKIAMRPGRPLACGKVGDAVFFGLPGNPVAVLVTFYEFVQPAVRRLMGCRDDGQPFRFRVPCTSALRKSSGRTEYQRGILYHDDDGQLAVKTTGKQGAGRLSSLCLANCIIVIPPNADAITPGSLVEVQPFTGLV